jgi:hypothetical protein
MALGTQDIAAHFPRHQAAFSGRICACLVCLEEGFAGCQCGPVLVDMCNGAQIKTTFHLSADCAAVAVAASE